MVSQSNPGVDYLLKNFPNVVSVNANQVINNFKADIVLKPNSSPIFHKAYDVPYKLREDVEKELQRMCNDGILVPVKHSRWASPIVVVPKPQSIRICMDCKKTINKFIEMEHYPLPKAEDIFADLAGCEYFCTIDLSNAYLLIGLFRYTRLPFGLASAPAIFQSVMDQVLVNLNKVKCYLDDILVGGSTKEELKEKLRIVLSRLNDHNIRINLSKCKFLVQEVNFLGHVISKSGIRPKPEKMEAIANAPSPKNVSELQAYLGMLNYYGQYIPNLSVEIRELYDLLRKDVKFEWTQEKQNVFEKSKQLLLNNNVLELYDPSKEIVVSADGSPYGVGAVLSHVVNGVEKPVLFASSSLSPAEKNYSQLHREALAIIFAVKKFHKYIYGRHFTICSDNQALREIFSPSKGTSTVSASRLQRWAVLLSMYDYTLKYRPAKEMQNADALSRLPLPCPTEIKSFSVNRMMSTNCPIKYETLKQSQSESKVIVQIIKYLKNGWPKEVKNGELKYFYKLRDKFSLEDNCLFYYDRIVVPSEWKEAVLTVLHECHTGIVRMKMISRSYVWWPSMNIDIENFVKSCPICQQTRNVKKEVVVTKWPKCSFPFERIHIDFFHFHGKTYLIIMDAFSKFIEVKLMGKTDTKSVVKVLLQLFAYYGLPKEIVSDNGPPFNSSEFDEFGQSNGIKITKTPPYHAQSNGQGERGVQTVKDVLKKLFLENKHADPNELLTKFLFHYRNNICTTTMKSPNDIILSYKSRTHLTLLNPKSDNKSVNKKVFNKQESEFNKSKKFNKSNKKQVSQYEKYIKNKVIFNGGEKVFYRNHFKSDVKWIPATIVRRLSSVMYLIKIHDVLHRTVHENQLRRSNLADKYHPNVDPIPLPLPKFADKRKRSESTSPTIPRRSKRVRRPITRYPRNHNLSHIIQ